MLDLIPVSLVSYLQSCKGLLCRFAEVVRRFICFIKMRCSLATAQTFMASGKHPAFTLSSSNMQHHLISDASYSYVKG